MTLNMQRFYIEVKHARFISFPTQKRKPIHIEEQDSSILELVYFKPASELPYCTLVFCRM